MNTSIRNCIAVVIAALLAGLAVFILSILNVLAFETVSALFPLFILTAFVLYAVFFHALVHAEKNRLVREAVCCCGKAAIIGFIGTLVFAPITLLLFGGTVRILFDLALGFTFFFYTMLLAGMGCILTIIYQCRRNEC